MIKTTKHYIVVFLALIFAHTQGYSQYIGDSGDGATTDILNLTSCSTPPQFFAYQGGTGDGAITDIASYTTCASPPQFFAYQGGLADGATTDLINLTACGNPPQFFAYFGGDADGATLDQLSLTACATPPQFYAYFGGSGDGFTRDTLNFCPTIPPVANFSASNVSICAGGTTVFTDLSTNFPVAWNWSFPGGTPSSSSVQNPSVTYNTPGTYSVTLSATNAFGSNTFSSTGYITVNAFPTANAGSNVAICNGDSTNLNASGGATYSWSPSLGLSSTNIANPTATPTTTTTYTVAVTTSGCSATSTVTVTVNPTPIVDAGSNVSVCNGSTTILNASGGTSYAWLPVLGLSSSTVANPSANPTATTTYTVTANIGACSSMDTVIVTVNTLPSITATSSDAAICIGDSVNLTGGGAVSYLWSNAVVDGINFSPTSTNTYTVTGTDANGCVNTASTTVTVNALPTVIANSSAAAICAGSSVTLTGSGASTYTWDNSVINAVSFTPTATATYNVTGTDANGCINTANTTVVVNALPTATFTPFTSPICLQATSITLTGGSPAGGIYSGTGVTGGIFNPSVAGVGIFPITYTVTDSASCSNTSSTNITVQDCTGINENPTSQEVSIYPNPTNGIFTIAIQNANFNELEISIVDIQGKIVYTAKDKNSSVDYQRILNLENLSKGIYYIKLSSDTNIIMKKLILQ